MLDLYRPYRSNFADPQGATRAAVFPDNQVSSEQSKKDIVWDRM